MKPFDKLAKDISAGFDLLPAIKVISECDSERALTTLRKQINKRLREIRKLTLSGK